MNYLNNYNGFRLRLKDITLYILLLFPLSSMLKIYIGPLNVLLTGITFVLFFMLDVTEGIRKVDFYLLAYIGLTFIYNVAIWGLDYYEDNMLFYFPFLLMFFGFFIRYSDYILEFLASHKQYIDFILLIWNGLVFISLFFFFFYVYEGETRGFVSFAGTTFLLCAMAIYVFALLTFQYYLYKKKIYFIALVIPSLCILMGTTRTYLVVLLCAWLIFFYINMRNQRWYVPLMIFVAAFFVLIVLLSPISDKFINTSARSGDLGMDPLEAITSGRSVFWAYDINAIFQNSPFKIIFGNGVNWLFNLNRERFHNPLWAHNDFIQILSDYGLFGLGIYLWSVKRIMNYFFSESKISERVVLIVVVM